MYLKPPAVLTVTERQVLLTAAPPPQTQQLSFLMHEVRGNATLMKHLMTAMRDGVKQSGVCEQERRRQAWR